MAERRPTIPESQLLEVIRNPAKAEESAKKHAQRRLWLSFFSWSALRGRWAFFTKKTRPSGGKTSIDLRGLNVLLNVLIVFFFIFGIRHFTGDLDRANRVDDLSWSSGSRSVSIDDAPAWSPSADLLDRPRLRDLFRFDDVKAKVEEIPEPVIDVVEEADPGFADHLRLVGISYSDRPEAMIKDLDTEEIYFLKRGDWISEDIKVEAVSKESVIISSKGREVEMK